MNKGQRFKSRKHRFPFEVLRFLNSPQEKKLAKHPIEFAYLHKVYAHPKNPSKQYRIPAVAVTDYVRGVKVYKPAW